MPSVKRCANIILLIVLGLIVLIALLSIARAAYPAPTQFEVTWTSDTKATLSWRQQSDANYVCIYQQHPDGTGGLLLFDCIDTPDTPSLRYLTLPYKNTEQGVRPQVGDTYFIQEYRLESDYIIEYGKYGPAPLLFRTRLLEVFMPGDEAVTSPSPVPSPTFSSYPKPASR